jgi:universal stress protein A
MAEYEHVLCATDLSPRATLLGSHAVDLARRYGARVSFLHVIQERDWGARSEIEKQPHESDAPLMSEARERLARLAEELGVPEAGQYVLIAGSVGPQIIHLAERVEADLIVVGSRGRHGLALLLGGSTPDEVLHGARRDVLAVYLPR